MKRRRLKGASKYVLRAQAAMAFQRAETLYYRRFRKWLWRRFSGELRLGFGWTEDKFVSELVHLRVVKGKLGDNVMPAMITMEYRNIEYIIDNEWHTIGYTLLYEKAKQDYGLAMEAIESGATDTMTEQELQDLIYKAADEVPYINPGKCKG